MNFTTTRLTNNPSIFFNQQLNVIFLVTLLRTMCGLQRVPSGTSAHDNSKTGVGFVGALRAACLLFPLYGFSFLVVSARPKLSQ